MSPSSLLAALAVAMLGNLLSVWFNPWVLNFWSTTSRARLDKRIAKLQALQVEASQTWHFSDSEWEIFRLIHAGAAAVLGFLQFLFFTGLFSASGNSNGVNAQSLDVLNRIIIVVVTWLAAGTTFVTVSLLGRIRNRATTLHSPAAVEDLKTEIERLLRKRQPTTSDE